MKKIYTTLLFGMISLHVMCQWTTNTLVNTEASGTNAGTCETVNTSDGKTWMAYFKAIGAPNYYEMRAQLLDKHGVKQLGPEGMLVYANDFTIEHVAIEDSKGDGLKINDGENVTIRDVRVEWTGGPKTTNGAYGIYPVKSKNVLIEDSASFGASDAGIYVGQSQNVIVRRNRAERNVAGIEIENTIGADVYENTATGNTGGILVFNMPNLSQPGQSTRVFKNKSTENNLGNFAAKGAAVASVPAGSGVVVNSNPKVEIFDNDIADNKTANLIISSYYSTNYYNRPGVDPKYDPYPRAIYVYGNRFRGGGDSPDGMELKALKVSMFGLNGHFPDVVWDGYQDSRTLVNGLPPAGERICIQNGDIEVLNADGPNKFSHPKLDATSFQCELPKLDVRVRFPPGAKKRTRTK